MALKIRFVKFRNALALQVLDMPQELRGKTARVDGLAVISNKSVRPDSVDGNATLYLPGAKASRDNEVAVRYFETNGDRNRWMDRALLGLSRFSGRPAVSARSGKLAKVVTFG